MIDEALDIAHRSGLPALAGAAGRECSDVPGAGLGLVLVKELVELMGGDLVLQSQAGVGTAVLVSLPHN